MHRAIATRIVQWFTLAASLAAIGAFAANPMLGEVEIVAATKAERSAGVWVDGQYMGHVGQLRGKSRLFLLPGQHELVLALVGYDEVRETITVEPGGHDRFRLTMRQKETLSYPDDEEVARLILSVEPRDAAVFVNEQYAGHVERFSGAKGMQLRAGTYRFRIALPGYRPFDTEITLQASQRYEIKTRLAKGTIAEQDENLIVGRRETR